MPEPINPKKRALMQSSPLRRALRAAGHHLSPVVQVGKEGVTEAVLRQLDEALETHELVKVKVGTESPEDRFEAAARIGAAPDVQVAQVLGRTMLVYRRHPEKPRFEPAPRSEAGAPDARSARAPSARRGKSRRPAPGRAPGQRSASDRAPSRRPAPGRPSGQRSAADRGPERRPTSGRPPARRPTLDRGPERRSASGGPPARRSTSDRGPERRPTSGRPPRRRPASRRPKR